MHKVEALEGVLLLDATKEVHATLLAGMALNGGGLVDHGELGLVGGHRELVLGNDAHDTEKGALGLPALGAAAGMVVQDVGAEGDFDGRAAAVTLQQSCS